MTTKAMAPKPTVPAPTPSKSRTLCRPTDCSGGASGVVIGTVGWETASSEWSSAGCSCKSAGVAVGTMATRVALGVGVALGTTVGVGDGETAGAWGTLVAVGGGAVLREVVAVGALAGVAVGGGVGVGSVTLMVSS